jgi:FkbH-like protein
MYEIEAQSAAASIGEIPSSVRLKFAELARRLDKRTQLPWSEDCSESKAPACYSTCSFYTPRPDLKCRRFAEGIVRLDFAKGVNPYIMKVTFRLWGMLSSPGNIRMQPLADARWHEERERRLAGLIRWMPLGFATKLRHAQRRHFVRNTEAAVPADEGETPSYFLIEVYNPNDAPADLTVIMRPEGTPKAAPFQTVVTSEPGYRRIAIDAELIGARIDLRKPFRIDIIAEHRDEPLTLYFGAIDFVLDPVYGGANARACAAVIWELDNIVWNGVLAEQGAKTVKRRDDIVAVIRELSGRGIRHAVVSRNDMGEAEAALKRLKLDRAFVAARYTWGPKSHAIDDLVTEWKISREQLIVVEDLAFDRAELARNCPGLRIVGAAQALKLPVRRECQGREAGEGAAEIKPSPPQAAFDAPDDHDIEFLHEIEIRFGVTRTEPGDLKALAALLDRAHATGIGGKRLKADRLRAILKTKTLDAWTLQCRDRFGDHGIVGWCVVDKTANAAVELVLAREIAGRRLNLAILNWLIDTYADEDTPLEIHCRPGAGNIQWRTFLLRAGFVAAREQGGIAVYAATATRDDGGDGAVHIDHEPEAADEQVFAEAD